MQSRTVGARSRPHYNRPAHNRPHHVGQNASLQTANSPSRSDSGNSNELSLIFKICPPNVTEVEISQICDHFGQCNIILNRVGQYNFVNYSDFRADYKDVLAALLEIGIVADITKRYKEKLSLNSNEKGVQYCVYCQKSTDTRCNRCGDYYCSIACQTLDWNNHRYICFPMPQLVKGQPTGVDEPIQNTHIIANKNHVTYTPKINTQLNGKDETPKHRIAEIVETSTHKNNPRVNKAKQFHTNKAAVEAVEPSTHKNNPRVNKAKQFHTNKAASLTSENNENKSTPKTAQQKNPALISSSTAQSALPTSQINENNLSKSFCKSTPSTSSNVSNNNTSSATPCLPSTSNVKKYESKTDQTLTCYDNLEHHVHKSLQSPIVSNTEKVEPEKKNANKSKYEDFTVYSISDMNINPTVKTLLVENKREETESCAGSTISVAISMLVEPIKIPQVRSTVTITGVWSPERIYVRSLDRQADRNYNKIIQTISNLASKSSCLSDMPIVNSLAACKFDENDDVQYRVNILEANSKDSIVVNFIDLGIIRRKKLSDLKLLPDSCQSFSRYVFPINLINIPTNGKKDKMMDYLKSIESDVSKQFRIVYDKVEQITNCELISKLTLESLNNKLADLVYFEETVNKNEIDLMNTPPVLKAPFKTINVSAADKVKLMVVNNSTLDCGYFAACLFQNYTDLDNLQQIVNEYGSKDSRSYRAIDNEYCLVSTDIDEDIKFARAVVKECLSHDKYEVYFMDLGYEDTVELENIRKYPEQLTEPCVTIKCGLEGLPNKITREVANFLKQHIVKDQMKIGKITEIQNDLVHVEIKSLTDQLQHEILF